MMDKQKDFNEYKEEHTPHIVQEVVCLKCLYRWIAVRPKGVMLKDLKCANLSFLCGRTGYVIATGQELEVEDNG
jgi:hypothetical protein